MLRRRRFHNLLIETSLPLSSVSQNISIGVVQLPLEGWYANNAFLLDKLGRVAPMLMIEISTEGYSIIFY